MRNLAAGRKKKKTDSLITITILDENSEAALRRSWQRWQTGADKKEARKGLKISVSFFILLHIIIVAQLRKSCRWRKYFLGGSRFNLACRNRIQNLTEHKGPCSVPRQFVCTV